MSIQGIMGRRGEDALREDYKMVEVILSSPRGFLRRRGAGPSTWWRNAWSGSGLPFTSSIRSCTTPTSVAELEQKRGHHGGGGRRSARRFR